MPTTQALTSSESNNAARGRPVLMGANALELATNQHWSTAGGSFAAASLGYFGDPVLAFDRKGDPTTRPNPAAATPAEYVLAFELPTNVRVCDAAALIGTNLQALAATYSDSILVDLDTADAQDFTTGLTQAATWTVTSSGPNRLGALFSTAYVGQRWWRFTFNRLSGGNFSTSAVPQIGEAWVGKRRQLAFNPQRPYDPDATEVLEDQVDLPGGTIVGMTSTARRGIWDLRWRLREDEWAVAARDVLRAWFVDSEGARASIWWPSSLTPNRVHLTRPRERSLVMPEVSHALQEGRLSLVELPPFYAPEVATIGV